MPRLRPHLTPSSNIVVPAGPAQPIKTAGTVPSYSSKNVTRRQVTMEFGDTHEGKVLRIPYGTCRFSPLAVHVEIPTSSSTMFLIYSLGEGEIDSVSSVLYNGTQIFDGTNQLVAWASTQVKTGSTSQTAFTSPPPSWPVSTQPGHALLYIQVNLSSSDIPGGQPDIEVIMKGRKLYDFRTTGTGWSDNPVLIAYDLLTHAEYGAGVAAAQLDIVGTWTTAANRCDEQVNSQSRWRGSTVVIDRQSAVDIIADLLQKTCAGFLYWIDGKWYIGLDEQHVIGCRPSGTTPVGTTDRAQSFVAPGPRIKPAIKLDLAGGFTAPTLRLRSTLAGGDLATATAAGLSAGTNQEVSFDLSAYQLTPGATYYLVLLATTGVTWHQIGTDQYVGGSSWNNSAGWTQEATKDFWFQCHYADWEITDALTCGTGQIPILGNGQKSSLSFTRARAESSNVVIITYYDITTWQQVEVRYEGPGLKAGTEQPRELREQMMAIPTADQAYRLAMQWYNLAQRTLHVGVTVPQHGIQIAPGDVVALTSAIGPFNAVWFRVQPGPQRSFGTFTLELVPYVWGDYAREETASLDTITIPNAASTSKFLLITDDFTRGGTTTGTIGELGWTLNSGSVSYIAVSGHPGVIEVASGVISLNATGQLWADKSIWATRTIFRPNAITVGQYVGNTNNSTFQVQIFASAGPVYTLWVEGASTGLTCALTDWITVICSCDGGSAALCTVYKNGVAWYGTSKAVSSTTVNRYLQCIAIGASSAADFDLAEVKLGATR